MTDLLERAHHLEKLEGLLAAAAQGHGHVAALTGDAGVGKTALTEAAADRARGARIFRGACEDLAVAAPLGPLHDLARAARWDLDQAIGRHDQQLRLFGEALDVFDRAGGATLLIIEDLHWADDATLDFVRFLGRRVSESHVLLLVTGRSDFVDARTRLRRALAAVPPDRLARIPLAPLSEAAVADLAQRSGMDGPAVWQATAGNAFFVNELIRAGHSHGVPPSVQDAVLARADRLSAGARAILDSAAIFPRRVEAGALDVLGGAETAAGLDECLAAGLLEPSGDHGIAFRHELARRAVEAVLSPIARRRLNAWALQVLRARPEATTAQLLHHAREATDTETVLELAPIAAREAARLGAYREAAEHFAVALTLADTWPAAERAELCAEAAQAFHFCGRNAEAVRAQTAAVGLYREAGARLREGDGLRRLSRYCYSAGDRRAADTHAQRAADLLGNLPGPELAMAWSNLSQLAMLAWDRKGARAWGERAIELGERLALPDVIGHALNNIGYMEQWGGDPDQGRRLLDRSLAIALEQGRADDAGRAYANRVCLEYAQLDGARTRAALDAGIPFCLEHGIDYMRYYMLGWKAELLLREGAWAAAAAEAEAVFERAQGVGHYWYPAALVLARLYTRRGEPSAAPMLTALRTYLEQGSELQRFAPYAAIMAERAWLGLEDAAEALDLLEQAIAMALDPHLIPEVLFWRRRLDPDRPVPTGDFAMLEPWRLMVAGAGEIAADAWAAVGAPYEQALALLDGDADAERRALEIVVSLGADAVAQHLRGLLHARGVRGVAAGPRASTRANPAGLTRRQMDVLRLLDQGRSNTEIAALLFVSPKTVDHHVSAILARLDSRSRGEAAAAARRIGLFQS